MMLRAKGDIGKPDVAATGLVAAQASEVQKTGAEA